MKNITIALENYSNKNAFELLEVSRRKQYVNGEPTDNLDTVYKVLINYNPTDIRVNDDGAIFMEADKVFSHVQSGNPMKITFENAQVVISAKSQYEIAVRGSATKANLKSQNTVKINQK